MIKIIGIGNSLMGDDSIALKVIDSIQKKVEELESDIKCIKAETDFDFALDNIEDGDYLFILDGTLLGLEYGQVTQIPLAQVEKYSTYSLSIHNLNLLSLINHFNVKVEGLILGIEVVQVKFSLEISQELKDRFKKICFQVYTIIKEKSLEYKKKGVNNA